ncbi:MAG: hypothetical protein RR327_04245, partial [Clostridia bacterium]
MDEFKDIRINNVKVNGICKNYVCKNTLKYAEEVELLNDFSIDNESVDSAYIPKVQFEFSKMTIENYQWFMRNVNKKSFTADYYDYTLGKAVSRNMYLETDDIERLYIIGGNL